MDALSFLNDDSEEETPETPAAPAGSETPAPAKSASSFLNEDAPAEPQPGAAPLADPAAPQPADAMAGADAALEQMSKMLFMPKAKEVEQVSALVTDGAKQLVPIFKRAATDITKPLVDPFKDPKAKTPLGRALAPAKGLAAFAARPLTTEIPGAERASEAVRDFAQDDVTLEGEAYRTGKTPWGMIGKRMAGEGASLFIPKTGFDVLALAAPTKAGWGKEALEAVFPKIAGKSVLLGEIPAAVRAIEEVRPVSAITKGAKVPMGDPIADVASRVVRKFKGEKTPYTLSNLYQDTLNRFHSIEKYSEIAAEGHAGALRPGENPGLLARSYLGMAGKVNSFLEHKTFRLDPEGNVQFAGPGLKEILEPLGNNMEDLSNYLVARRAVSLAERKIETGVDIGQAQKAVLQLEAKNPLIKEIAESHIQKWQDDLLQYLKDSGRIGEKQYGAIKAANDFYAPMQRVLDESDPMAFNLKNRDVFNRVISPVQKIKGSEAKILDPLEAMVKNAHSIIDAADRNRVAKSVISLRTRNEALKDAIQVVSKPGKDTITGYFGGQPVHARVPKELLESMRGLSEEQAGWLQKILQAPTAILRSGATLSPEFALRNPIRDQWSGMINSKYGFRPFYDAFRGAFSIAKADDAYWRWQASGGAQSFLVSMDRTMNDLLWAPPKGYRESLAAYFKNPLKVFQDVSEGLEKPTRVGLFKKAKEAGASDLAAGFESREGTVDFARRGMQTRGLNALYAFFNARLQGVDKTFRAFKENPGRSALLASPLTAASVALYLHNRSDPEYKEIPQWQKDLFWMTKIGDRWIRIPKGEIGIIFGSTAEHALEYMDNHEPGKIAAFAFEAFANLAPVDLNNGGIIPTAIKPVIENLANYNYFLKRQIVSEGKQKLLPEYQSNRFDTETAKMMGRLLGVSPSKVTNLIMGYTGGMGRLGLAAADKAGQAAGVLSTPPSLPTHPEDVPGIKGFIVREPSGSSSQSVNDFYQSWEKIQQAKNTIRQYPDKLAEIGAQHPEWKAFGLFNNTNRGLNDLRKLRDMIMASQMTPDAKERKLESINAQMTKLARMANETLQKMTKPKKAAAQSASAFLGNP